ncbi:MAG: hypothetical protein JKY99_06205 [Rhizobiales bacterium]|nr:hypothetical protein [Hyphomicrobiales bacterium]
MLAKDRTIETPITDTKDQNNATQANKTARTIQFPTIVIPQTMRGIHRGLYIVKNTLGKFYYCFVYYFN